MNAKRRPARSSRGPSASSLTDSTVSVFIVRWRHAPSAVGWARHTPATGFIVASRSWGMGVDEPAQYCRPRGTGPVPIPSQPEPSSWNACRSGLTMWFGTDSTNCGRFWFDEIGIDRVKSVGARPKRTVPTFRAEGDERGTPAHRSSDPLDRHGSLRQSVRLSRQGNQVRGFDPGRSQVRRSVPGSTCSEHSSECVSCRLPMVRMGSREPEGLRVCVTELSLSATRRHA